jgi:hypothetical protein
MKYGIPIDMRHFRVGLVIRRYQKTLETITAAMKYSRREETYVTKLRSKDEITEHECWTFIVYIPGKKSYAVRNFNQKKDCPPDDTLIKEWVAEQGE